LSVENIAFIGAGNMATSLVGGLIGKGYPATAIRVSDPAVESRNRLADHYGVLATADNSSAVADAGVVILAVKPQVMAAVASALAPSLGHRPLIISIAAGIPVNALQGWLGADTAVIRCMPNTPALVRTGATALYASQQVNFSEGDDFIEFSIDLGLPHSQNCAV